MKEFIERENGMGGKVVEKVITWDKPDELQRLDSGMYVGYNEDGKRVVVMRDKGKGWSVSTPTHHDWHEVVYYDETGLMECVTYEKW